MIPLALAEIKKLAEFTFLMTVFLGTTRGVGLDSLILTGGKSHLQSQGITFSAREE